MRLWWDMIPTEWSELTEIRKKNSGESRGRAWGPAPLSLLLDQTNEAWRAPFPLYLRVWMTAALPPTPSTSPLLKAWICHWRVRVVEAALWIKLLKVFFRLKQLNSLFGKKIPYHFWNFHNIISVYCFKLITVSKWDNVLTLCFSQQQNKGYNSLILSEILFLQLRALHYSG